MLTTITVIAGFSVGGGLILIPLFFSIWSRSFGKDIVFMMTMGLIMVSMATWQLIKPDVETGYIPWDSSQQTDSAQTN